MIMVDQAEIQQKQNRLPAERAHTRLANGRMHSSSFLRDCDDFKMLLAALKAANKK